MLLFIRTFRKARIAAYMSLLVVLMVPWSLASATLYWDSAGGEGILGQLNLGTSDSPSTSSSYRNTNEYYTKEGFLGRFVYEGPPTQLEFKNVGPTATGGSDALYYTDIGTTDRWRRYFLVATIVAFTHPNPNNGNRTRINISKDIDGANTIIENPLVTTSSTINLANGAGIEQYDTNSPLYSGGYTWQGVFGTGASYKYVYPYDIIWIDLTVIRASESNDLSNNWGNLRTRTFESQIRITDTNQAISMTISLGGYTRSTSSASDMYSFTVNRMSADIIPFNELIQKTTSSNSYHVGNVAYQSVNSKATVKFSSDLEGNQGNFKFIDKTDLHALKVIPYNVGFKSITPFNNNTVQVTNTTTFPTTTNKVTVTSPIYGETEKQYVLEGEIRIWVNPNLGLSVYTVFSGNYSSTIYCHVTV